MIWGLLLLVALCVSFMLSGLESAVLSVSRVRMRHAAASGDAKAALLLPLVEDRDALLGAITVANHVVNLGAFVIIAWRMVGLHGPWSHLGAFLLALPVFLIGLEVLPKKLFRRYPFRSLRALMPLVLLVGTVRPFFRALSRVSSGGGAVAPESSAGRDGLCAQVRALGERGQLSRNATRLLESVLSYHRLRVADAMRPLAHSIAVAAEMPLQSAAILAREYGCQSLPVLGEQGRFVGLLEMSSVPPVIPQDRLVRQHMLTLDAVAAAEPAWRTLQRLRKRGHVLMLVTDAEGQPAGLVFEEDLLRRLMHLAG